MAKGVRWLLTHQQADGSWDESLGSGATKQAIYYRDWIPAGVLSRVSLVSGLFPAVGLDDLSQGDGEKLATRDLGT